MGVYIKDMEMPKSCEDCPLENCDENYYGDESNHRCSLIYKGYTSNNRYEKRRDDCPLVPVPPHGRLIDADALSAKLNTMLSMAFGEGNTAFHFAYRSLGKMVENVPTIIPAEPGEDGK